MQNAARERSFDNLTIVMVAFKGLIEYLSKKDITAGVTADQLNPNQRNIKIQEEGSNSNHNTSFNTSELVPKRQINQTPLGQNSSMKANALNADNLLSQIQKKYQSTNTAAASEPSFANKERSQSLEASGGITKPKLADKRNTNIDDNRARNASPTSFPSL